MLVNGKQQLKLIHKAKILISRFENYKFELGRDNSFYLATYSKGIGNLLLKRLKKNYKISLQDLVALIKDFFYSSYFLNFKIYYSKKTIKSYSKIVISWAFKKNFEIDGSFNDRYFNINSKQEPNILWYLIYLDKDIPKKINNNIILYKPIEKKSFKIGIFTKILLRNFKYLFKDINYFLSNLSSYIFFSKIFSQNLKKKINENVKHILIPYEGQPFQNEIIQIFKNKIKIIGYIHSPPLAIPTNFIYKSNSPDKIILNGEDQLTCFNNLLGWKKDKIKILPSDRFLKNSKSIKSNIIYFPLSINSKKKILSSLMFLLKKKNMELNKFTIQNHPGAINSKPNIELINEMKMILRKNKKKQIKNKEKFSIFIGASGGIVEALERGIKVIQICEDPIFEMYSKEVWPNIKKEIISDNIFKYSLLKKGKLIKLGNKPKNLNHYFKSIK